MSLAVLHSRSILGMDAPPVTVEAHLAHGLASFTVLGLLDTEVKEAKDRVRPALQTARFDFPARRITVNLAPADLPKGSGRFDLPIALGILAATGQVPDDKFAELEFAGELALTGELRPFRGALAMTYRGQHAMPDAQGELLLKQAVSRLGLSARGFHRILKVARSIADLAGEIRVASTHVAEAIQYRRTDHT